MKARTIRALGTYLTLAVGIGIGYMWAIYGTSPHRFNLVLLVSIVPLVIASSVGMAGELIDRGDA